MLWSALPHSAAGVRNIQGKLARAEAAEIRKDTVVEKQQEWWNTARERSSRIFKIARNALYLVDS